MSPTFKTCKTCWTKKYLDSTLYRSIYVSDLQAEVMKIVEQNDFDGQFPNSGVHPLGCFPPKWTPCMEHVPCTLHIYHDIFIWHSCCDWYPRSHGGSIICALENKSWKIVASDPSTPDMLNDSTNMDRLEVSQRVSKKPSMGLVDIYLHENHKKFSHSCR